MNVLLSKKSGNLISVVNEDSSITTNDDDLLFDVYSDDNINNDSIVEHYTTDEILQQSKIKFHKKDTYKSVYD